MKLNERFADANWHVKENTTEHHTNEYVRTDNSLVLRRGQSFKVSNLGLDRKRTGNSYPTGPILILQTIFKFTARLNRPFDESKDKIKLDLRYGSNSNLTNGTAVVVDPKDSFH